MSLTLDDPRLLDERVPDYPVLAAAACAAVGTDLALRSGVVCLAGSLLVAVAALGLAAGGRLRNPQAVAMVALTPAFGVFLSLRSSEWLTVVDIAAVAGLLLAAASFARTGDVFDVRPRGLTVRLGHALTHGFTAPGFLARCMPPLRGRSSTPVVRGVALALPLVIVLGALLASGDAVFASVFRIRFDPSAWIAHAVLLGIGAWGMGGLLHVAAAEAPPDPLQEPQRLGVVEASVVLGSLVALYCAYAVTLVLAALQGDRKVLETTGLTYAEYARSGFVQLLAVAAITLVTLAVVRSRTQPDGRLTALALAAVVLTLVIVGVAVRRLHLYEDAFGLTYQRLTAFVFAVWIGAVFVLLAASWTGVGRSRSWLPGGGAVIALGLLFVLNVADPDALIARRNLDHPRFDPWHAARLSDDAVPVLVEGLPRLAPAVREETLGYLCNPSRILLAGEGWAGWNRSIRRAEAARRTVCPAGERPPALLGP